jgi:hypothetical protein
MPKKRFGAEQIVMLLRQIEVVLGDVISPTDRVGASWVLTQISKMRRFIGWSTTKGAVSAPRRKPAMKV